MAGTGSIALERQEKLNEKKHAWKMNEMVRLDIKVLLQASTSLCSDFLSVFSYLAFTCSVMRAFVLVYIQVKVIFTFVKQLKQLQRNPRKITEASTEFEPMTSKIPVSCSTN